MLLHDTCAEIHGCSSVRNANIHRDFSIIGSRCRRTKAADIIQKIPIHTFNVKIYLTDDDDINVTPVIRRPSPCKMNMIDITHARRPLGLRADPVGSLALSLCVRQVCSLTFA